MTSFTGLPADLKSQGNLIFFQGNFEDWSVKNKNPQKSGKSQGKIILKDTFFLLLLLAMAVFLHKIFH